MQVDDAAEREDQRKAERDEQVVGSDQEPVENLLGDEDDLHGETFAASGSSRFPQLVGGTVGFIRSCRCRPWAGR